MLTAHEYRVHQIRGHRGRNDSPLINYSSSSTKRNFGNCRASIATLSLFLSLSLARACDPRYIDVNSVLEKWSVFSDMRASSEITRECPFDSALARAQNSAADLTEQR